MRMAIGLAALLTLAAASASAGHDPDLSCLGPAPAERAGGMPEIDKVFSGTLTEARSKADIRLTVPQSMAIRATLEALEGVALDKFGLFLRYRDDTGESRVDDVRQEIRSGVEVSFIHADDTGTPDIYVVRLVADLRRDKTATYRVRVRTLARGDLGLRHDAGTVTGDEIPERALVLPLGRPIEAHIFIGDEDTFRIGEVPLGATIRMRLISIEGGEGTELTFILYRWWCPEPDGKPFHTHEANTDVLRQGGAGWKPLEYKVTRAGVYYLHVSGGARGVSKYSFQTDVVPGPDILSRVEIVAPDPPHAPLDEVAVGERFRVRLVFSQNPKWDAESVTLKSTPAGEKIEVEAKRTGDPLVFLTEPVLVVLPEAPGAEPPGQRRVEP